MLERIEIVDKKLKNLKLIKLLFYDTFVEEVLRREDFFTAKKREKLVDLKELILLLKRSNKNGEGGKNRIIYFIKYFFEKFISQLVYARTNSTNKLVPFRNYCFNNLAKLFFDRRRRGRRRRGRLESIQLLALFQKGREIGLIYYPSPLNLAS